METIFPFIPKTELTVINPRCQESPKSMMHYINYFQRQICFGLIINCMHYIKGTSVGARFRSWPAMQSSEAGYIRINNQKKPQQCCYRVHHCMQLLCLVISVVALVPFNVCTRLMKNWSTSISPLTTTTTHTQKIAFLHVTKLFVQTRSQVLYFYELWFLEHYWL